MLRIRELESLKRTEWAADLRERLEKTETFRQVSWTALQFHPGVAMASGAYTLGSGKTAQGEETSRAWGALEIVLGLAAGYGTGFMRGQLERAPSGLSSMDDVRRLNESRRAFVLDPPPVRASGEAQIRFNKRMGEWGEVQSGRLAESQGLELRGREITFELPSGKRTRSDWVTVDPESSSFGIREAKTGNAVLSEGQIEMQLTIERGGTVIPRGKRAERAGLTPGVPISPSTFTVDRFTPQ